MSERLKSHPELGKSVNTLKMHLKRIEAQSRVKSIQSDGEKLLFLYCNYVRKWLLGSTICGVWLIGPL